MPVESGASGEPQPNETHQPPPAEVTYSIADLDVLLLDSWDRVALESDLRTVYPGPVPLYRVFTELPISADDLTWTISHPVPGGGIWTEVMAASIEKKTNRYWHSFIGWRLNLYGLLANWSSADPPPWPAVHYSVSTNGEIEPRLIIQVWRGRAWRSDSPIYAELSWTPKRGQIWQTGGYANPPTDEEWSAAKRGLALLDRTVRVGGGRPPGSKEKYPTPEKYVAAIHKLYARAQRSGWTLDEASDQQLADWLRISKHTMYARNTEYEISSEDIRRRRV
jgi:hypothetical protein